MVAVSIELEGNSGEGDLLWLFVCQDCQDNKISQSQTEYLKQHKFTFLIFLDSGSPRPSCEKIRFLLSPLSWLPDGQLLTVCSHDHLSDHVHPWCPSSYMDTNHIELRCLKISRQHFILIPYRPNFQIWSQWAARDSSKHEFRRDTIQPIKSNKFHDSWISQVSALSKE